MRSFTEPNRLARRAASLTALIVALALSGCAAADDEASAPPASADETTAPVDSNDATDGDEADGDGDAEGDNSGSFLPGEGAGEFLFGFTPYEVTEVIQCDPAVGPEGRLFDAVVRGRSEEGTFMAFFVYTLDINGTQLSYVDYSGDEGIWSSDDGNAIISVTDSVSGAVPVINEEGDTSELIQFNVPLPAELTDCS